jgi:two-component system response regulator YesN
MKYILNVMLADKLVNEREKIKMLNVWGKERGFIISEEADDANEILTKLEKYSIDILIKSIDISNVNGLELLKKIKEKNLCSCVILLSDNSDYIYVRNSFVNGVFDYLIKPINEDEFKKVLDRARQYIFEKEQKEILYNYSDIKQISSMLIEGDRSVYDVILSLTNRMSVSLNYDFSKMEVLLKRLMILIINVLKESCEWLDKFIYGNEWIDIDFSKFKSFDESTIIVEIMVTKAISDFEKLALVQYKDDIVRRVCDCVLINIDYGISLEFIAEKLFMSKNYISRTFKDKTGIPFNKYLTRVKIERAERLIVEGKYRIYEISNMLGFADVEYFSKLFKKYKGVIPKEMMK